MKCMVCQAVLTASDYCPKCGSYIKAQKKAGALSNLYYNQGLEKAQIRDLSGAVTCLKRSLKMNKLNIQARNLLGLVYYETGEVVAALSSRKTRISWTPLTPALRNTTNVWNIAEAETKIWPKCSLKKC